jgi:uncharacterized linocin/CFP29 family protein
VNHLLRSLAPLSDETWQLLDEEARQRLKPSLAARRVVDFRGPHGWEHSATNLGRVEAPKRAPVGGVSGRLRRVLPLVELRADFELPLNELRDADRGADDVGLGPLDAAAFNIAVAENTAVFQGWPGVASGIAESSPHEAGTLGEEPDAYPEQVGEAVERLRASGIDGPFALALGGDYYQRAIESTLGGYPLADHLTRITESPLVRAPGLDGGVVLSLRGGDFVLDVGQDLSIGYESHDAVTVHLYLEESFSFHVATPEAAVALKPAKSKKP